MTETRKLIEVALPLDAINKEAAREKSIRAGHPSTLHIWWARRPLAACRAVLFASLVDDPSSHPDRFPTDADQDAERDRLFDLIKRLVLWENSSDRDISWEETKIAGPEALAVRVGKKLRNEATLITEYSGVRLRMDLDRVPLWRGDHVTLRQLWSDYCQYLYLPRFRNSAVLVDAVRSGVALFSWTTDTFAYASAYDEQVNRYVGLTAGQHPAVVLDPASVVVRAEVALRQIDSEQAHIAETVVSDVSVGLTNGVPATASDAGVVERAVRAHTLPTHFYGQVTLESLRMTRDVADIADAIVNQLGRADAAVTITVEIDATTDRGFPEDVQRTIGENARTLKFDIYEFEDG